VDDISPASVSLSWPIKLLCLVESLSRSSPEPDSAAWLPVEIVERQSAFKGCNLLTIWARINVKDRLIMNPASAASIPDKKPDKKKYVSVDAGMVNKKPKLSITFRASVAVTFQQMREGTLPRRNAEVNPMVKCYDSTYS
jgi:hypothetical protein